MISTQDNGSVFTGIISVCVCVRVFGEEGIFGRMPVMSQRSIKMFLNVLFLRLPHSLTHNSMRHKRFSHNVYEHELTGKKHSEIARAERKPDEEKGEVRYLAERNAAPPAARTLRLKKNIHRNFFSSCKTALRRDASGSP